MNPVMPYKRPRAEHGRGQTVPPSNRNGGAAATRRAVDEAAETEPGLIGAQAPFTIY